jgi:hypothetical protein
MEFQYHINWITQTDESKGYWQAISKEEKTKINNAYNDFLDFKILS